MDNFIDIKQTLKEKGLKKTNVAALIFPDVKFPSRAFSRVLSGKTELTTSQITKLAEILEVRVEDLFEPDRFKWDVKDGKHIFLYGNEFRAEVDMETWNTRLYHCGELIKEDVICDGSTPISEFLSTLKNLITDWNDLL